MPIMGQRVTSVTSSAPPSLQATAVSGATTSQRSSSTMTLPRGRAWPLRHRVPADAVAGLPAGQRVAGPALEAVDRNG